MIRFLNNFSNIARSAWALTTPSLVPPAIILGTSVHTGMGCYIMPFMMFHLWRTSAQTCFLLQTISYSLVDGIISMFSCVPPTDPWTSSSRLSSPYLGSSMFSRLMLIPCVEPCPAAKGPKSGFFPYWKTRGLASFITKRSEAWLLSFVFDRCQLQEALTFPSRFFNPRFLIPWPWPFRAYFEWE